MRQPASLILLALAVLHYTVVPNAYADTGRGVRPATADERSDYAAREAASERAADFVGGQQSSTADDSFDPVVFTLVLVGVIVFVVLIVALAAAADASAQGTRSGPPVPVVTWTCPQCGGSHGQAGNCPQCGMTLIRK